MKRSKYDTYKLADTDAIIGDNSKLEKYWNKRGFEKFYKNYRSGTLPEKRFLSFEELFNVVKSYNLQAIGFGNWVTQEDRFNYTSALFISLYDLDKVVQFKKNIGLNSKVSISFGARGQSRALAHFEPVTFIINITRYSRPEGETKKRMFLTSGGVGALAHEYGHALDYYFGLYRDQKKGVNALSGGSVVNTKYYDDSGMLRKQMSDLLDLVIWKNRHVEYSNYYKRLKEYHPTKYMLSRNEIFARVFEKYVQYKLSNMGIKNAFLAQTKYSTTAYPKDSELEKIVPAMDKLITSMRKLIS